MIGLLVVAQLTWAEPVDAVALANKAERATDLIERCRIQGRGCGASPDLLAEAFVTRALHALTVETAGSSGGTASVVPPPSGH